MDDLISRQAVNDALDKTCDIVCQYSKKQRYAMCGACPLGSAFDTIEELPAADVVEVVRCKDCRLSEPGIGIEYWCCYWDNKTLENGYCSYGERKDV